MKNFPNPLNRHLQSAPQAFVNNQNSSNSNQYSRFPGITYPQSQNNINTNNTSFSNATRANNKRPRREYEETENQHNNYQPPAQRIRLEDANHNQPGQIINNQLLQFTGQNPETSAQIIELLTFQNSLLSQALLINGQQLFFKDVSILLQLTQQTTLINQNDSYRHQHDSDVSKIEELEAKLAEQKRRNEEQKTIIDHQSSELAEEKSKNEDKQNTIDRQSIMIDQYIEQKGYLAEQLFLYEQKKPHPDKLSVLKKLEKTLLTKASRSLLVDFVINEIDKNNELKELGRVEVDGRKQHRHIIPHAMLTKTVETAIKSEKTATLLIANLSEIITAIYNFKENICLRKKEYIKLNPDKDIYFDKITTTSDTYYFINAEQHDIVYSDLGTTANEAKNLFDHKYRKHIIHDLEKLAQAAGDDINTTTMISELLVKFIYTIFNQNSVVSYPDAGNSRNYEIRLYKNTKDAKNPKDKKYEVLTHSEVSKYFEEGKEKDLSGKIRIVNNEGDIIKKSLKAFELFDKIISCETTLKDNTDLINQYNDSYNKTLKLENLSVNLECYNKALTKDDLESQIIFHIVKYLYFSLDFKPLEKNVFVPSSKKGIKIYDNATTKTTSYFDITDGPKFRNDERKYYQDKMPCREEEVNKTALGEKIYDQVNLLSLAYPSFDDDSRIKDFIDKISRKYFELCSLAHNIDLHIEDFAYKAAHNIFFDEHSVVLDGDITVETPWG